MKSQRCCSQSGCGKPGLALLPQQEPAFARAAFMASPASPPAPLARLPSPTVPAGDARLRAVVAGDRVGPFKQAARRSRPATTKFSCLGSFQTH
ncbi:hypothetical protein NN561_007118 [Cricetulus griseus]